MEPYDEDLIEHNDCPPLALSEWQQWGDPDGSEATMMEVHAAYGL